MKERIGREAALTEAERALSEATEAWVNAKAELEAANAAWGKILLDRRKARCDRRKIVMNPSCLTFADRRKAETDRRERRAAITSFCKLVADQHGAYLSRNEAEERLALAEARLRAVTLAFNRAGRDLYALGRANEPRNSEN